MVVHVKFFQLLYISENFMIKSWGGRVGGKNLVTLYKSENSRVLFLKEYFTIKYLNRFQKSINTPEKLKKREK